MNITLSDAGASFTQDDVGKPLISKGPVDHPRTWYWVVSGFGLTWWLHRKLKSSIVNRLIFPLEDFIGDKLEDRIADLDRQLAEAGPDEVARIVRERDKADHRLDQLTGASYWLTKHHPLMPKFIRPLFYAKNPNCGTFKITAVKSATQLSYVDVEKVLEKE
jgi:hypothetical protein